MRTIRLLLTLWPLWGLPAVILAPPYAAIASALAIWVGVLAERDLARRVMRVSDSALRRDLEIAATNAVGPALRSLPNETYHGMLHTSRRTVGHAIVDAIWPYIVDERAKRADTPTDIDATRMDGHCRASGLAPGDRVRGAFDLATVDSVLPDGRVVVVWDEVDDTGYWRRGPTTSIRYADTLTKLPADTPKRARSDID